MFVLAVQRGRRWILPAAAAIRVPARRPSHRHGSRGGRDRAGRAGRRRPAGRGLGEIRPTPGRPAPPGAQLHGRREHDVLLRHLHVLDRLGAARAQERDHPLDQVLRRGGAGREADRPASRSHVGSISPSSSIRCAGDARRPRHLDQPVGVRRVGRADHQHDVGARGDGLHRLLAVLGRVADVVGRRALQRGEPPAQDVDDHRGVVHRQRRLAEVRDAVGSSTRRRRLLAVCTSTARSGACPAVPITSSWSACPISRIVSVAAGEPAGLAVHLGDQRAGRVDDRQLPRRWRCRAPPARRRAPRTRPARPPARRARLDEDRALGSRPATTCRLCTISRRTYTGDRTCEGALHRVDGALDAAQSPRGRVRRFRFIGSC